MAKSVDQEHELNFCVHPSSFLFQGLTLNLTLWPPHPSNHGQDVFLLRPRRHFSDKAVVFTGVSEVRAVTEDAPVGKKGHNRGRALRVMVI